MEPYVNEVMPPFGATPQESGAEPEVEKQVEVKPEESAEVAETQEHEETPEQKEEKEVSGIQKRIDELTKKRREAEREAEYWKQKAESVVKPQQPTDYATTPKPMVDQFDSYEDFVEALADWKTDIKLARRDSEAAQRHAQEQVKTAAEIHAARVDAIKSTYADYDEAVESLADIYVPQPTIDSIIESEASAEIAYYLGKNPDVARRLNSMTMSAQLREIGKIEAMVTMGKKEAVKQQVKRVTQAPSPINPVGSKEKAGISPDNMTDEDWLRHERDRLRKLGRLY